MSTYHLTADELMLIYLTFLARDEEGAHKEYFDQWFSNGGSERLRDLFESLKSKGIIHKDYSTNTWDPNQIEFNKNFIKSWTKNSLEMGQELMNEYPTYIYISGQKAPLKDVSKRFCSLDDFFFFYSTQIGHNPEKHKEILDLVKWGKENNQISFNILSFVISHQWNTLKEFRDNPDPIKVVDTIYENA